MVSVPVNPNEEVEGGVSFVPVNHNDRCQGVSFVPVKPSEMDMASVPVSQSEEYEEVCPWYL